MNPECTNLDHSDYEKSHNFWGLERKRENIRDCKRCGRPEFQTWFDQLEWTSTDRAYWKNVFKEAREQKAFFFRAEPAERYSWGIEVDPDTDLNAALRPTRPEWARGNLSDVIVKSRYERRLKRPKEHDYEVYQAAINAEMARMTANLDYVDNRRFAALDSRKDMRRYNDQKARGCCGSRDEVVTIYGKKFTIGCNYGH